MSPTSGRTQRLHLLVLGTIVLLGAVLRLGDLDLMEFKGDEAVALDLARPLARGESFPGVGLMSSVGVHNPPLFVALTALPMLVCADPVFVTGVLVGLPGVLAVLATCFLLRRRLGAFTALGSAALLAVSTWPVLYNRKVWAQDILPLFCVATLAVLLRVTEKRHAKSVAWLPILLCALWQIHFSAVGLGLVALVVIVRARAELHWRAFAAGCVGAAILLVPFVQHQARHGWEDVAGLANMARGLKADGTPRTDVKQLKLDLVADTLDISVGTRIDYALGPSTGSFEASRSAIGGHLARLSDRVGRSLVALGLIGSLGWLCVRAWRRWRGDAQQDRPPEATPRDGTHFVLLLWTLGYWLSLIALRLEHNFPHYAIILYPAPLVFAVLPLDFLVRRHARAPRVRLALACATLAIVAAGHVSTLLDLRAYLDATGGARGDYGTVYRHKAALARWAVARNLALDDAPWEVHRLVEMARTEGSAADLDAVLVAHPTAVEGMRRARVRDTLLAPAPRCERPERFGPLRACPEP